MKKAKNYSSILLMVAILITPIYSLVYWISNEELTKIQVFKELWYLWCGVIIAVIILSIINYER